MLIKTPNYYLVIRDPISKKYWDGELPPIFTESPMNLDYFHSGKGTQYPLNSFRISCLLGQYHAWRTRRILADDWELHHPGGIESLPENLEILKIITEEKIVDQIVVNPINDERIQFLIRFENGFFRKTGHASFRKCIEALARRNDFNSFKFMLPLKNYQLDEIFDENLPNSMIIHRWLCLKSIADLSIARMYIDKMTHIYDLDEMKRLV